MTFYSQSGQDEWINKIFNGKRYGYYVDIGAYDGLESSNTAYFEKDLDWDGICVEANPSYYSRLTANRASQNVFAAVSNYNGVIKFGNDSISENGVEVPCKTLNTILEECNAPAFIDYLSIDVEGHEPTILEAFDFDRWRFGAMTVEHNLYCWGDANKVRLHELLTSKGYIRVVEDAPCLDTNPMYYQQPYEDWYVNTEILGEVNL